MYRGSQAMKLYNFVTYWPLDCLQNVHVYVQVICMENERVKRRVKSLYFSFCYQEAKKVFP